MKNLISLTGGLILASVLFYNIAFAYNDKTTHWALTRETIDFYELSTGKKFSDEQKQWIIQGSVDEDLAPRWLNHFYDPVFERGLSTEIPAVNGYLAKNWGQFSSYQTINIANISTWWGDFSYETAIKDYSVNKEKDAYLALGHVLHLIEDMTVPEHTRNDIHPGGNLLSFYENWTMQNSSSLMQDLGKKLFVKGNKPVVYADLPSYFNNLATYTNNYFFSPHTINSEIYLKPKIVFEDGTFAYGRDENGEFFDLAVVKDNIKSGSKSYLIKDENYQVIQEYWLRLSRQAIINGAGVIQLFMNQAEAAKQTELTKQKTGPNKSLVSQIYEFFVGSNSDSGNADLVIVSEPVPAQPKIKSTMPLKTVPAISQKPIISQQSTTNFVATTTSQNSQTKTQSQPQTQTQVPQTSTPVVYGGGGGGSTLSTNSEQISLTTSGGSSSNSNSTQQTINQQNNSTSNVATTTENLNIQTFNAGDLVINEIMYNPEGTDDKHEWVELYNNSGHEIILTGGSNGWKFDDGATSLHGLNEPPTNGSRGSMTIATGGYIVLADNAETFLTDYSGYSGTVIDTVMDLRNSTSTIKAIKIIAPSGTAIDEVLYSSSWGADGNGKTLERKSANGGSNDGENWAQSSAPGGTPGTANNWELTAPTTSLTTSDIDSSATTTLAAATSSPPLLGLGTDVPATTTISTDMTWTLFGSPYRLFFDSQRRPTVAAGAVLTIEPGVKIIPQSGGSTALEVQGVLNAIGTADAPIIFTSIADADDLASTTPQKGDWLNIAFSQGAQGNLNYVEFHYGGQGITLPLREMVDVRGATVNINHSKFENSQNTALHLMDSSGVVENSIFSDNGCGISVDSINGIANTVYGGCYGIHTTGQILSSAALQIRNNQFVRNQIGVEVRSGTAPTIDTNIFADNGYPIKIESSYPLIANSQVANSTSSPNVLNGVAISGYTHFSQNYTLKKDLPYILETNGPDLTPTVDSGATLTIEPGVILKPNHTFSAMHISGNLISSGKSDNPVVFTSFKNDIAGGDTNGDGSITSPQDSDWSNIKFLYGSTGDFSNTIFSYGGYGYIAPSSAPPLSELPIENFDSYSIGALSGQGDWGGGNPSNQIAVTSTTTHDGANSVGLSGGDGAYTYRVLTQPISENGILSYWVYYNSLGGQGVSISDSNNNMVAGIYYDYSNHNCSTDDGNCWALMGDGDMGHFVRTNIQTTAGVWHFIELEISFSSQKIRMRQDIGNWSNWVTSSRTNLGRIRFDRGYGDIFFDTFTYLKPVSDILINSVLSIDVGATIVIQ